FVFSALVILTTLVLNDAPAGQSAAGLIFSAISVLAILLLIVTLISGRRITERRLRDQTDLLSITLSSIADAVIATDAEGRIGFINPTAARLTGCSPAAVIGQPLAATYQTVDQT